MRLPIAAAALGLVACTSLWRGNVRTSRATFEPTQRELIWAAAIEELGGRGFAVDEANHEEGSIESATTERPGRVPCGMTTCRYRDTVVVLIAVDASVTVRLIRELAFPVLFPAGGIIVPTEGWGPPSRWQKATLAGIEAEQDEILRAITQRVAPGSAKADVTLPQDALQAK